MFRSAAIPLAAARANPALSALEIAFTILIPFFSFADSTTPR
jgi:hypothetical protein